MALGVIGFFCALVGLLLINGVSIATSGLTGPPQ